MSFYVYAFIRDDGTPYYIGKGSKRRAWEKHRRGAKPKEDLSNVVILERNLTEIGAFAIERRLIRWFGRKDIGNGILINFTDGGEGTSGYIASKETRQKLSKALVGRSRSDEEKKNCSAAWTNERKSVQAQKMRGKTNPWSNKSEKWKEEHSKRMSGENHHGYGKSRTDDSKKNMSIAALKLPKFPCVVCNKYFYAKHLVQHNNRKTPCS